MDATLVMLQEVTQKILEAVGTVAGSSLEQTSWLSRNLEVKAQPQILPDEFNVEDVNGNVAFPDSCCSPSPAGGTEEQEGFDDVGFASVYISV